MKTVLVVDDSKTIRTAVSWTLRGPDIEVVQSHDAASARAELDRASPDLILLDVALGPDDGLELCEAVKAHPSWAHIPVLLMNNALIPIDAGRVHSVGASGHVEKPFETQTLIDLVRAHVGLPVDEEAPTTYAGRLARQRAAAARVKPASAQPPPIPVDAPPPPVASPFGPPRTRTPTPPPAESFEVAIDEREPIELDGDQIAALDPPARAGSVEVGGEDEVSVPAGPTLEPPPPPADRASDVQVDVWALVDDQQAPSRPPPRLPPPLSSPRVEGGMEAITGAVAEAAAERAPDLRTLPQDELRAIARDVIEAIAWEVVPDLAETIIREELTRLLASSPSPSS